MTPQRSEDEGPNPEMRTFGTLGLELFRLQVVTFDFPRQEFTIEEESLPEPDGQTIFHYSLDHTTPVIQVRLGPLETTANAAPLKRSGEIETTFRKVPLYRATLNGDLVIGTFAFHHPKLLCSELFGYVNLGRDLLYRFAISFDQRQQHLRFTAINYD